MRNLFLIGISAALAACTGDDTTCGMGTTMVGSMCIATGDGSGSGTDLTCGPGTHLDGTSCVPDDNTVAAAPTVDGIDPPASGIAGSVLFTISGTGFAGSNVTDLHVFFGNPLDASCEAQVGAATATTIAGEVPRGCTLSSSVTVSVITNLGTATIPFEYEMIFAADGDGGGSVRAGGELWVIDPFLGMSFDLGALTDGQSGYGITGMDFDATGTLYAATTGDSPADINGVSQLVTISLADGSVTAKGDAFDASSNAYYLRDIKFVGGTLYGWGYFNDGHATQRTLVSIDTATGAVTPIGTATPDDSFTGALAVDSIGQLIGATDGAGADSVSRFAMTGVINAIDPTTGNHSQVGVLDWPVGAPIQAMSTFQGQAPLIVGVIDNGTYGAWNTVPLFGETLAVIDVANQTVEPALELPALTGAQSHVDALAVPPVTLTVARTLAHDRWTQLDGVGIAR
jgi:hypothetical protein